MLVGMGSGMIWSIVLVILDINIWGGMFGSVCWSGLVGGGCEVCGGSCRYGRIVW